MKRNINNELSSSQKLNHERENNQIPPNTQNTKKKTNRNIISSNTYNSKFSKEN